MAPLDLIQPCAHHGWKRRHRLGTRKRFLAAGSKVLVAGRRADKLERVAPDNPGPLTFANDIGSVRERERLVAHVRDVMPNITVAINHVGLVSFELFLSRNRLPAIAADKKGQAESA